MDVPVAPVSRRIVTHNSVLQDLTPLPMAMPSQQPLDQW